MITKDSIETAYSFLHQKRNVYIHSTLDWQKDDIELAIGSYVGTFISHLLNIELLGKGYLTNFVFCVVGAVTVLWIWKKLFD